MNSKIDPAGPVRFKTKNALNWVQPKKIIFFIFNCVLFKKISVKHYSITTYIRRGLLDDAAFTAFDCNLNFIRDGIVDNLMK